MKIVLIRCRGEGSGAPSIGSTRNWRIYLSGNSPMSITKASGFPENPGEVVWNVGGGVQWKRALIFVLSASAFAVSPPFS